ncbi:UNKNOWN [Stylonychia lemnae]|uniref:Uncharacterized protein n=1 Tax=Stylonychia lemnae TaxID=5949 RepID=A0A078A8S6_STYLE|nr:UNKNOWN [Stylonychia lemnae]|eukprot:CDW78629.1 UNKNOWN [Stylonychia lemnae]
MDSRLNQTNFIPVIIKEESKPKSQQTGKKTKHQNFSMLQNYLQQQQTQPNQTQQEGTIQLQIKRGGRDAFDRQHISRNKNMIDIYNGGISSDARHAKTPITMFERVNNNRKNMLNTDSTASQIYASKQNENHINESAKIVTQRVNTKESIRKSINLSKSRSKSSKKSTPRKKKFYDQSLVNQSSISSENNNHSDDDKLYKIERNFDQINLENPEKESNSKLLLNNDSGITYPGIKIKGADSLRNDKKDRVKKRQHTQNNYSKIKQSLYATQLNNDSASNFYTTQVNVIYPQSSQKGNRGDILSQSSPNSKNNSYKALKDIKRSRQITEDEMYKVINRIRKLTLEEARLSRREHSQQSQRKAEQLGLPQLEISFQLQRIKKQQVNELYDRQERNRKQKIQIENSIRKNKYIQIHENQQLSSAVKESRKKMRKEQKYFEEQMKAQKTYQHDVIKFYQDNYIKQKINQFREQKIQSARKQREQQFYEQQRALKSREKQLQQAKRIEESLENKIKLKQTASRFTYDRNKSPAGLTKYNNSYLNSLQNENSLTKFDKRVLHTTIF